MKNRWRDRGKEAHQHVDQPPPPPYQEEWVDARVSEVADHHVCTSSFPHVYQLSASQSQSPTPQPKSEEQTESQPHAIHMKKTRTAPSTVRSRPVGSARHRRPIAKTRVTRTSIAPSGEGSSMTPLWSHQQPQEDADDSMNQVIINSFQHL